MKAADIEVGKRYLCKSADGQAGPARVLAKGVAYNKDRGGIEPPQKSKSHSVLVQFDPEVGVRTREGIEGAAFVRPADVGDEA